MLHRLSGHKSKFKLHQTDLVMKFKHTTWFMIYRPGKQNLGAQSDTGVESSHKAAAHKVGAGMRSYNSMCQICSSKFRAGAQQTWEQMMDKQSTG